MALFSFNNNRSSNKQFGVLLILFLLLARLCLLAFWCFDSPAEAGDDPGHLDNLFKTKEWFGE